jgi:hypothetical protein
MAQSQSIAPATPKPDEGPPTTRLAVHPQGPPAAALKYRLLPWYLDLAPGNAAVLYLKALPEGGDASIRSKSERLEQLLDQPRDQFQVEEARKLISELGSSLFDFLRLASTRADCDWNLPIREQDWYSVLLPELQTMREFGRCLALKARVQIADGQYEQAIDTLRIGYAVARHAAEAPTLVNSLVGVAIARLMNKQLLELVQSPRAPNLYWTLAALPSPFIDARSAMDMEAEGVFLVFPQIKDVATTTLTDAQWSVRLAEFTQKLNSFEPLISGTNQRDWKDRLALGIGIAAWTAIQYPRAKRDLVSYGWPKEQIDRMPAAQVILLHIGQTYEVLRDEQFKWFYLPYPEASEGMWTAQESLNKNKNQEILPLAGLLLPGVANARTALVRIDREFAAIRTVEAIRGYAAKNGGKLPEKLADISEVPVPLDPMTGDAFSYTLDGQTATLEGRAPKRSPERDAFRYVVTIAQKSRSPAVAVQTPAAPQRPSPETHTSASETASQVGRDLIGAFTANPIWYIGENGRRAKSLNNLKQLALAMHNYHDVHKHFPPASFTDKTGKPLLSWRVHVLPYVEENELYRQFKLDEPWDSEHNKKLIEKMPDVFRVPALPALPQYTTTYLVPAGEGTVFHDNAGTPLKEIKDGTSKTIFIVEANADQAAIWTKPDDLAFDPKQPTRGLGKLRDGGFLAAFADGSVRRIDLKRNDEDVVRRLMMRADGLPVRVE